MTNRYYTEAERQYIAQTYRTQTVREQARALGRGYRSVVEARRALVRAGIVNPTERKSHRPWTDQDRHALEEMIVNGASVQNMARNLSRGVPATYAYLLRTGRSLSALRDGTIAVRTQRDVARLFGVGELVVKRWISHQWLHAHRNAVKAKSKYKKKAQRLITDEVILTFIARRDLWPVWDAERITDPDWRDAALDLRRAAGGRWWTVTELSREMHFSTQRISYWLKHDCWQVEKVQIGRQWYVWGAVPPVPPFGG